MIWFAHHFWALPSSALWQDMDRLRLHTAYRPTADTQWRCDRSFTVVNVQKDDWLCLSYMTFHIYTSCRHQITGWPQNNHYLVVISLFIWKTPHKIDYLIKLGVKETLELYNFVLNILCVAQFVTSLITELESEKEKRWNSKKLNMNLHLKYVVRVEFIACWCELMQNGPRTIIDVTHRIFNTVR